MTFGVKTAAELNRMLGLLHLRRTFMTVTVSFPDVALEELEAKASHGVVDCLGPLAVMKLYASGQPFASVAAESPGKGRVEFMDRLAKHGGRSVRPVPEELVQRFGSHRSLSS
jgi:hypothetical protein